MKSRRVIIINTMFLTYLFFFFLKYLNTNYHISLNQVGSTNTPSIVIWALYYISLLVNVPSKYFLHQEQWHVYWASKNFYQDSLFLHFQEKQIKGHTKCTYLGIANSHITTLPSSPAQTNTWYCHFLSYQ